MKNKSIKKEAKKALKRNYWKIIAVVFFVSIMTGSFTIYFSNIEFSKLPFSNIVNSDIAKEFIESITKLNFDFTAYKPSRGILANVFNNVTSSGSFIFGILNSLNQLIFHERIWASIIILFGAFLTFMYWLFIQNALYVGQARFFLENRNHKKTNFKRIFLPFRIKMLNRVSITMMKKSLLEWLWWLTIIGGIIKHYAYAFVPFILAENPGIKSKEAIKLSCEMMKGNKYQLFKLDMSFLLWHIIDLFTFHLLYVIFISPYKKCCLAEFYLEVRKKKKKEKVENSDLLCDEYLLKVEDIYPKDKFLYKEQPKKIHINTNFDKNYSFTSLILMFFASAIIGWIWEVGFHLFRYGSFVNRGALHGPWLPIYGWGMILLLIVLKKYRKDPFRTFILSMLICGAVEYATSCYLEIFKNASWWDYEGYFLNLNGRICLEGLIGFGIGGCAFIYFAAPCIESILSKINKKVKIILCILLSTFYIADAIYSSPHPNTGDGVSKELLVYNLRTY